MAEEGIMKLKNGFVLKEIAGECVVVAVDAALDLDGMITLNDTAKTMWLCLENGADRAQLIGALTDEYEVSAELAAEAVDQFTARLEELGFLA
jgi:hypothetical protein